MTAASAPSPAVPSPLAAPSQQAMAQAAEWFALLRSGEATAAEREQWRIWLDSSRDHQQAWRCVERISQRFAPIQSSASPQAAAAAFQQANPGPLPRRQLLLGLTAMTGTGLIGGYAWRISPLPNLAQIRLAEHRTGTGDLREIVLSDGTRVWLNTASAFNTDYSDDVRRLHLLSGEMLVQTAADPTRPFVVDTPQGRLRALGTRFTVRLDGTQTLAAVYHGAVEVRTGTANTTAVIAAGQQMRFTQAALSALETADPAREAWTRGILIAQNIPLTEVVQELRRHHKGHLSLAPEVADLRVFGSYPINNPDRALAMLESVMPIRVRRRLSWWVRLEGER